MRKFILTLMASLLSYSAAFAFWPEATDSSLEIGVGYRQDKIEWRTSSHFDSTYYGNDTYYDTLYLPLRLSSKLEWKNLHIWQIEAKGKYVTCDNIYLRVNGDYGWITSGKNVDKDFVGDTYYGYDSYDDLEFAHSSSKVKGHVYDAKLAAGYQFKMCDDSFAIAPLIGYSWHGQHLRDRHLRQSFYLDDTTYTFDDDTYTSSSYDYYSYGRNHSKYNTRWNGPFIGFDFDYRFGCDWTIFGGYEFHWARYHARADWGLRNDLLDGFKHRAKNAYGHVFDIGVKMDLCDWTVGVKGMFQWWHAHSGRDRALVAEGEIGDVRTDCYLTIPLRDIKWCSAGVSLDVGMAF